MLNKYLVAAIAATLAMAASQAMAEGKYVSVSAGSLGKTDFSYGSAATATVTDQYKAGSQLSVAYGQKLTGNWRVEAFVASGSQDLEKAVSKSGSLTYTNTLNGSIKLATLGANVFYDFPVKGPLKPYLGGGIGATKVELDDNIYLNDSTTGMSVQAIAGATFTVAKHADIFAEARYERQGRFTIETTSGNSKSSTDVALDNTAFVAGLRINF